MHQHRFALEVLTKEPGKYWFDQRLAGRDGGRLEGLNAALHHSAIMKDSHLAEIDADKFDDGETGQNFGEMFEAVYNMPHATALEFSKSCDKNTRPVDKLINLLGSVLLAPHIHDDVKNLYQWVLEYIDRYHLWRESATRTIMAGRQKFYLPKTKRWSTYSKLVYYLILTKSNRISTPSSFLTADFHSTEG